MNGKSYVGQTTQAFKQRYNEHISDTFKSNKIKANNKFHNALRKYGIQNFKWEILFSDVEVNKLDNLEIEMIKKYNCLKNGYNSLDGGHSRCMTDVVKKKISLAAVNRFSDFQERKMASKRAIERFKNMSPDEISLMHGGKLFSVFKKDTGEFVGNWINKKQCERDLGCFRGNIFKCLKGKLKSTHGYIFRYLQEGV